MPRTNLEVHRIAHVPGSDAWTIYFPWTKNPLPMNGSHGHHLAHARQAKRIRNEAGTMISYARIPHLGRCRAHLTWWYATNRVRDPDNLADLEKRLFDAIVDAGVVTDDRPELMDKPRAAIRNFRDSDGQLTGPGFTLTITRIGDTA